MSKKPSLEVEFAANGFDCMAYNSRSWLSKENPKTGESKSFLLHRAGIVLKDAKGNEVKFTFHRGTFGDSRRNEKEYAFKPERLKIRETLQVLTGMVGEDSAHRLVNMATY